MRKIIEFCEKEIEKKKEIIKFLEKEVKKEEKELMLLQCNSMREIRREGKESYEFKVKVKKEIINSLKEKAEEVNLRIYMLTRF